MSLAHAIFPTDIDCEAWSHDHDVKWCHRMSAKITPEHCQHNRTYSKSTFGDLRCEGCGGLDNQPVVKSPGPVLTLITGGANVDRQLSESEFVQGYGDDYADGIWPDRLTRELVAALRSILENTDDVGDEGDDESAPEAKLLSDVENTENELASDLLALLVGANTDESGEDDVESEVHGRRELLDPVERSRKVPVYVGRCIRCDGYMTHSFREAGDDGIDDAVYRCFNCGWRTSPKYYENSRYGITSW